MAKPKTPTSPSRSRKNRATAPIDRHALYQLAVQAPIEDARLLAAWFRRAAGRPLRVLREDFCGTAAISCAFVQDGRGKEGKLRRAIGVDLDEDTLIYGALHNVVALPLAMQRRVQLVHADVRDARVGKADLIAALNFSYCVFHQRSELLQWLRSCHRALRQGGAVVVDAFGGGLAHRPFRERFEHGAFAHEWEQRTFDPATHRVDCRIHFETKHGRLDDAFVYDWRMWTVPELCDALREAGFPQIEVLWQDPATMKFVPRANPPADPHWLAYVTGRRDGSRRARALPRG